MKNSNGQIFTCMLQMNPPLINTLMIWQMREVNWRFIWDILLYLKQIGEAVYKIFHLRALNGCKPGALRTPFAFFGYLL